MNVSFGCWRRSAISSGIMPSATATRCGTRESIRLQQAGVRRVRLVLGFATIALILAVGMLVLLVLRIAARLG